MSDVLDIIPSSAGGIVLTGEKATTLHPSLRERLCGPLLIDRRCYAGGKSRRKAGAEPISRAWLDAQRALGVASVLTDSGYVGKEDMAALRKVLSQAKGAGADVTAVLPLHSSWLLAPWTDHLVDEICLYETPVALVLEHRSDPLGHIRAVAGLKCLLERATVPVSLLSTDISGLGAIAHGALWAAVGATSSLRHLYPADASPPPPPDNGTRRRHTLVLPLLALMTVEKILEGVQATLEDPNLMHDVWTCDCRVCGNRTMEWLATASPTELAAHTFEPLLHLHEGITTLFPQQRPDSWLAKCKNAIHRHHELNAQRRLSWGVPGYLQAWVKSYPTLSATGRG
ncbi:hypothetical protein ACFFV7_27795 [Nonomuraea spiralis]|uniref:Uncharacterized protein n=1 Tax=Nonomuraea spiralis TaxID=46182 RepID=A0ABV5IKW9_9ACTN|nr:hypothetical protein [Nonomuraea spiralis]GGT19989.1 hypothetical protein GCM10010176_075690 [Nonomuraea spiralis]